VYPGSVAQFHLQQNTQADVTKQSKKQTVATDIRALFNTLNIDEAKRQLDLLIDQYQSSMPKLAQWTEDNIPEGLTVFALDLCEFNRKRLRISNRIERLNQRVK
jgi:putative transposase